MTSLINTSASVEHRGTAPVLPAPPTQAAGGMNVQRRAAAAARIFDIAATVVLAFGGLLVLGLVITGIVFLAASGGESAAPAALVIAGMVFSVVGVAIVTALQWAVITLATAVAGYVAQRSAQA